MKNSINLNENQMDRFAEATVQHNIEKQLKAKYGKILKENEKANSKKGTIIKMSSFIKIAAVVVTVLGSIFLIQESLFSPSAQSMAQNFLDETNISGNPDITRKGSDATKVAAEPENNVGDSFHSQILREANDAFVVKNYPLAIAKYEALESQNMLLSIDRFYLGISHLRASNFMKAISHFQEIKTKEKIQIEEIDWFLSLAFVLSNQEEKAKSILVEIVAENKYKSNEAEKLLKTLK